MKYRNVIIILGFLIVMIQFLGFPQSWRKSFHIASGALVVAFAYLAGKEARPKRMNPEVPVPSITP